MALRRGKLTDQEQTFIRENLAKCSPKQIALHLNRTEKAILDHIQENGLQGATKLVTETVDEDFDLRTRLKSRPYYNEVCKYLNKEELEYFTECWLKTIKQLREDVLYSEEQQIKHLIVLDIMANRVLIDRRKSEEQIETMERMLRAEQIKPIGAQDTSLMAQLESDISMIRNSMSNFTKEHLDLLKQHDNINKALKMARNERVKKIEDSKTSFSGFLKALEDIDIRIKIGEEAELGRLAQEAATDRLSSYHTFADGFIDQPLLTPENAMETSDE